MRKYFQQQYQNWIVLDGLKSKWWMWNSIIKEVSVSMTLIHRYLERTCSGKQKKLSQASDQLFTSKVKKQNKTLYVFKVKRMHLK